MQSVDKTIHCLLLIMLFVGHSAAQGQAGDSKGFAFPAVRPEQVGLSQPRLEQARDYAQSAGGSGMIVRHGKVVLRWGDQQKRYDIKSATKSFGATMLGVAILDGKIELNAPARRYHPSLGIPPQSNEKTDWLDDITIRHLATQTAGFEKPGGYENLLFAPGTQWHYSDGGPNWLAECITLQYGQDLEDLMFKRVLTPLGITRDDLRWRKNQYRTHEIAGIPRREFGAGIHANVEALSRLGYLYLRKGRWLNRRILSKTFVDVVSRPMESIVGLPEWSDGHGNASDHYSLLWWNNADGSLAEVPRDAYWAWGLYDSLIVVIPSLDLVVARGGERGGQLPRKDGAKPYDVLKPLLGPIVAAVLSLPQESAERKQEAGFIPLFNGKDLGGWVGDARFWIVRNGMLIGRSPGIKHYSFLTSVQAFEDFILRLQIKLVDGKGNTGVLFRSKRVPNSHEVAGYQADFAPGKHGNIFDESRRRKVLARPDAKVRADCLKRTDWNDYEIRTEGRRIVLSLNGVKLVDYVEPDTTIARQGLIALQINKGGPMEVQFRNIRIKEGAADEFSYR